MAYFNSFIFPFLLSLVLTPLVIYVARRFRIMDFPMEWRKTHAKPTPLFGGLAIFLSFFIILFLFINNGSIGEKALPKNILLGVFVGSIIIMIGGFLDDRYKLAPKHQIIFPTIATFIAIVSGTHISFITNPSGGVVNIVPVLGFIITFAWLMGMMYTTKFLDGLDGLVSGVTIIASFIIFIVSLFWDIKNSGTSHMSLMLAGAALGFLIYNFYPAKIFLGEGGSIFLGYMIGVLSIISGSKIATSILIMGLPIIDTLYVIIRRIRQGKSPAVGDREHFHYTLLDSGISQRKAVSIIYCTTLLFGLSSLFLNTKGKIIAICVLIITSIFLIKKLYSRSKNSRNHA